MIVCVRLCSQYVYVCLFITILRGCMLQQFSEGDLVAPSVTTTLVCSQQFQKHLGLS